MTEIEILDETIVVPEFQPGIITYDNRRFLVTGSALAEFQSAAAHATGPTWYRLGLTSVLLGPGIAVTTTVYVEDVTAFDFDLRADDPTAFGPAAV